MTGILYVAYGEAARQEIHYSLTALRQHSDLPVAVIAEEPIEGTQWVEWHEPGKGARWAKLNCHRLSPFDQTLYLDADTRVRADIGVGFDILDAGWDMVIVPSSNQGRETLWHIGAEEKGQTIEQVGFNPIQLQGGVYWYRKNERVWGFFDTWGEEWQRWGDKDQAACLRAYYRSPVKLWLLGFPWNGGACIQHLFGRIR